MEQSDCPRCGWASHAPDAFCAAGTEAQPSTTEPVEQPVQGVNGFPQVAPDARFEGLSAPQQQTVLVAVARVHDAEVGLWGALEELGMVARDLGCPWLGDRASSPRAERVLDDVRQVVADLRHLVGIDGGACNQRGCENIGQDNGEAFAVHVAEVVECVQAAERSRFAYRFVDVREAAAQYERVVIEAYNRDQDAA